MIIFLLFVFVFKVNASENKITADFSDCVDGDTIKVVIDDEVKTVRLLAIDTPETVKPGTEVQPYGKEASDYTCDKITNASKIELEFDPNSDKTDKYGRTLAWVYVDESLLESELISLGYAKVEYIYGDYLYTDNLYKLEEEAADKKLGIWSEEEYISTKEEEKTFWDKLEDLVSEYIEKWFKKIINKINKYIKNKIDSIFN